VEARGPRLPQGTGPTTRSLFKVGDAYFVEDGNHRVSVARYQGVEWIEAEVTILHGGTSVTQGSVAPQPVAA
jgi:hypothetical protein